MEMEMATDTTNITIEEKHVKEIQNYFPESKILLVDGEFFSWYGSRLSLAPAYFKTLIS